MNIFVVDLDPIISAKSLVDRHVVKMILESVQLLCVAHTINGPVQEGIWDSLGWRHHPCAKWTAASISNYNWLLEHAKGLCAEYQYRYGRIHKLESDGMIARLDQISPPITNIGLTQFVEATGNIHSCDPVSTYRQYYIENKSHLMTWTKREPPKWISEKMLVVKCGSKYFAKKR